MYVVVCVFVFKILKTVFMFVYIGVSFNPHSLNQSRDFKVSKVHEPVKTVNYPGSSACLPT